MTGESEERLDFSLETSGVEEEASLGITLVRLDQEYLGLEVLDVQEVITVDILTPLFRLPPHILGVINLRGHVLPVAQLGTLLGLPSAGATRGVVVRSPADAMHQAAFLVDVVIGIRWVRPSSLMEVPPTVEEDRREFFRALVPGKPAAILLRSERLFHSQSWCTK